MRDPRSQPAENDCLYLSGLRYVVVIATEKGLVLQYEDRWIPFTMNQFITAFKRAITSIKEL